MEGCEELGLYLSGTFRCRFYKKGCVSYSITTSSVDYWATYVSAYSFAPVLYT